MESIKQECKSDATAMNCNDDEWLSYLSNDEDKVKAEDLKPDKIKVEVNENENFVSQLKKAKNMKISKSGQKFKGTETCTKVVGKNKSQRKTFGEKTVEKVLKSTCKRVNFHHCSSLKEALVNAPRSETTLNLCKYQCPKCRSFYMSREILSRHFKKVHAFLDQGCFNNYLVKIIAHKCKICSKVLLCDRTTILSHVKYNHEVKNLNEYSDNKDCPKSYNKSARKKLNEFMFITYKSNNLIENVSNNQIFFNREEIKRLGLNLSTVQEAVVNEIINYQYVYKAYTATAMGNVSFSYGIERLLQNGFNQKRSGDVLIIPDPAHVSYNKTGSTHGSGLNYDTHVPLLLFGKGIKHGETVRKTTIPDIAPTISALLGISFPNGATGVPLEFVLD